MGINSQQSGQLTEFLDSIPPTLRATARFEEPLSRYTSLRVGGTARLYVPCFNTDDLAEAAAAVQLTGTNHLILGGGSNVCISDAGFPGVVIHNLSNTLQIGEITQVDCGFNFMQLFQKSAFASLSGLEFAVGIPGSVGGALVSNAGAYRKDIKGLVRAIEVVEGGIRKVVGPEWMEFSYRDSRLRSGLREPALLVSVTLNLIPGNRRKIIEEARDYQRQRISKQPWYPSAGSFFKNVNDFELAQSLATLTDGMKKNGVVPAGFLSDACGCRGLKLGGAEISERHGNFVINRAGATARDIFNLTREVKQRVASQFGVELEEEVMLVGEF